MDTNQQTGSNGANGVMAPDATELPACPLNSLPEELHQYIHKLEAKIVTLEDKAQRFENALKNLGGFIFKGPMSAMITAALPKEAQAKLKEYFSGNS